jgi:hypothetical protein
MNVDQEIVVVGLRDFNRYYRHGPRTSGDFKKNRPALIMG